MVVVYFSVIWAERHAWQTLESSFSMYYLVQKLETVMFERQHQYSSLFGTFKADQRNVCELQCNNDLAPPPSCLPSCLLDVKKDLKILCRALPPSCLPLHLPDVMHMTPSPRPSPSVFAYCKRSKTGGWNGLGMRLHWTMDWTMDKNLEWCGFPCRLFPCENLIA